MKICFLSTYCLFNDLRIRDMHALCFNQNPHSIPSSPIHPPPSSTQPSQLPGSFPSAMESTQHRQHAYWWRAPYWTTGCIFEENWFLDLTAIHCPCLEVGVALMITSSIHAGMSGSIPCRSHLLTASTSEFTCVSNCPDVSWKYCFIKVIHTLGLLTLFFSQCKRTKWPGIHWSWLFLLRKNQALSGKHLKLG